MGQLQNTPNKNAIRRRKKRTKDIFDTVVTENFPKLHQIPTTDPGSSGNTKHDKCQKTIPGHTVFKLQNIQNEKS